MSESAGEKTFAPTQKRLRDAAKEGDVVRSRELATAAVVLIGVAWLWLAGNQPRGQTQQCGLPTARRADDGRDLSWRNVETDAVERRIPPEVGVADVVDLEDRLGAGPGTRRSADLGLRHRRLGRS